MITSDYTLEITDEFFRYKSFVHDRNLENITVDRITDNLSSIVSMRAISALTPAKTIVYLINIKTNHTVEREVFGFIRMSDRDEVYDKLEKAWMNYKPPIT